MRQLQAGPADDALAFNLMVVLSVLGAAAPDSVLEAGGLAALLARCEPGAEESLQEVAVDAVCRYVSAVQRLLHAGPPLHGRRAGAEEALQV